MPPPSPFTPSNIRRTRRPQPTFSSPATGAWVTQVTAEHWLTTNPQGQVTQVAAEHWASTTSTGLQAVVTQIALEHWASVAIRAGGPIVTMIG
jgi:hypothetical protein